MVFKETAARRFQLPFRRGAAAAPGDGSATPSPAAGFRFHSTYNRPFAYHGQARALRVSALGRAGYRNPLVGGRQFAKRRDRVELDGRPRQWQTTSPRPGEPSAGASPVRARTPAEVAQRARSGIDEEVGGFLRRAERSFSDGDVVELQEFSDTYLGELDASEDGLAITADAPPRWAIRFPNVYNVLKVSLALSKTLAIHYAWHDRCQAAARFFEHYRDSEMRVTEASKRLREAVGDRVDAVESTLRRISDAVRGKADISASDLPLPSYWDLVELAGEVAEGKLAPGSFATLVRASLTSRFEEFLLGDDLLEPIVVLTRHGVTVSLDAVQEKYQAVLAAGARFSAEVAKARENIGDAPEPSEAI